MQNRERGAAHINIYFFLVLLVLFIGTLWFGYIQMGEVNLAQDAKLQAQKSELAAKRDLQHYQHYVAEISDVLGVKGTWDGKADYVWTERFDNVTPSPLSGVTVPADVKAQLEDLAKKLNLGATQATPLQPFAGQIYAQFSDLTAKVTKAELDVTAAQTQVASLRTKFDTDVAAQTKVNATQQADFTKKTNDLLTANQQKEQRIQSAFDEQKRIKLAKAQLEEDHAKAVKAFQKEKQKLDGQMEAWRALNAMRQPPQLADGSVITATMRAKRGWIDIGRKDMLLRGTKFRITDASGERVKGFGEVIQTNQDRSELRIFNVVDAIGDPIIKGDQIYNDIYSPNIKRNVAMIGRFSYPYTKPMVKKLLEKLGNTVHDKVQVGVDLVLVGLQDPTETGEGLKPVDEIPGYKEAQNLHCEIITIQKIRDLLKLGEE